MFLNWKEKSSHRSKEQNFKKEKHIKAYVNTVENQRQQESLKMSRNKNVITYKAITIEMTTDFSTETVDPGR